MPPYRVLSLIKGLGRGGAEQLLLSAIPYHSDRFRYEVAYRLPWKDALVPELTSAGLPVHCLGNDRGPSWVTHLRKLVNMPAAGRTDPPRLNEFTLNFEIRRTPAVGGPIPAAPVAKGGKS